MRRGDIVTVALQGEAGEPRPAAIVQTDFLPPRSRVPVVPLTSDVDDAPLSRMIVVPTPANGLRNESQSMFDRLTLARRDKCSEPFGRFDPQHLAELDRNPTIVLGLLDAQVAP